MGERDQSDEKGPHLVKRRAAWYMAHLRRIDLRKPCEGRNANVCVAEGCYGQSCLRTPPTTNDGRP